MKRIIIIILALLAFLTVVVMFCFLNKKETNNIKAYGNIEIRTVDLSFQVSGIIESVFVEEGDYVKKGQILAKLIDKDYLSNYKKAKYLAESSNAQKLEDESKYKRNIELCKDGTNSKQECDTLLNVKNL